jgi:hypothetical protein
MASSKTDQAAYDAFVASIAGGEYKGKLIKDLTHWRDEGGTHVLVTFVPDPDDPAFAPKNEHLTFDYGVNVGPK